MLDDEWVLSKLLSALESIDIDGVDGGTVGAVGTSVMKVVTVPAGGFAPTPVPVTADVLEDEDSSAWLLTRLELTLKEGVEGGTVGAVGTPVTTVVSGPVGGFAPVPIPVAIEVTTVTLNPFVRLETLSRTCFFSGCLTFGNYSAPTRKHHQSWEM